MKRRRGDTRATLDWIVRVAGKWKRGILWMLLVQLLLSALGVGRAWIYREVINAAAGGTGENGSCRLFLCSAALLSALALSIFFQSLLRYLKAYYRLHIGMEFRRRLYGSLMDREYAGVSSLHTGEWISRLNSDVAAITDAFVEIIPDVGGMAVRMLGALVSLLLLMPRIAAAILPAGILVLLISLWMRRNLKEIHRDVREAEDRVQIHFLDHLSGLSILHSYSREAYSRRTADRRMEDSVEKNMRRARFSNLANTGYSVIMEGGYVLGIVYCAWRILRGEMTYGTLLAVMALVGQLQSPFTHLAGYLPKYYAMLVSAERVREAEALPPDLPAGLKSREEVFRFYASAFSRVELNGVTFHYQARKSGSPVPPVLRELDFHFEKGEFVAFTGPSGCGKSTVLKLLLGFYPLERGNMRLYDREGGTQSLDSSWRRLFAYVPQGNQLMSGTIRKAVAFGAASGPEQEPALWRALTVACADGFVREKKEGLDYPLGERGQGLSEGQLQRLSIARAVFSGRPILLLDEATSSLDEDTEARVLRNLRGMTDCTVLIVTHRPAALGFCDREIHIPHFFAPQSSRNQEDLK